MKIAILGTHGIGKTTLAYEMAHFYKLQGKNVKVVQDVEHSSPFSSKKPDALSCIWLLNAHIEKELEALAKKVDVIICDRSAIDSIMYAKAANSSIGHIFDKMCQVANEWMSTYEKLIYVRPSDDICISNKNTGSEKFQRSVADRFEQWLESAPRCVRDKITVVESKDIFGRKRCWLQSKD
jgi:thymidylate kinase